MGDMQTQINTASKWSLLTEVISKLLPPVTNMILARLLTPEAFGLVATITMVTSFAEIFADAGFQKYLVQHDFEDEESFDCSTNVAFWSNLTISLLLWLLITLFRDGLAVAVGSRGLGVGIAVSAAAIPLTSFSSIQMSRFRRKMDFKSLFFVRVVGIFIPLFVTVPLAFILRNYWALVIGNLSVCTINAILLTVKSKWRPRFYFSFSCLKQMLSFSIWALIERLLGWANLNIGIFIVGMYLSEYYLGLYKISMAYVNQVLDIIVNSLAPVLLSSLARMNENGNDAESIPDFFYRFNEKVAMFIIPLGVGVFVFRTLFTQVLLGGQWEDATGFIGLWALMRTLSIVFDGFSMTLFIAIGKPKYAVLGQALTMCTLLSVLLLSAQYGYHTLYIARSLVVIFSTIVNAVLMKIAVNISPIRIVHLSAPYFFAAILMGSVGWCLQQVSSSIFWHFVSVFLCIIVYFAILCMQPRTRESFFAILRGVLGKSFLHKK